MGLMDNIKKAQGAPAGGRDDRLDHGARPGSDPVDKAYDIAVSVGALSDRTRRDMDENAHELAHMAYARARQLMHVNRECLDDLATSALQRETLTREDLDEIFAAHDLRRSLIPSNEDSEPRQVVGRERPHPAGELLPQQTRRDDPKRSD